jgi:hypothetical protein
MLFLNMVCLIVAFALTESSRDVDFSWNVSAENLDCKLPQNFVLKSEALKSIDGNKLDDKGCVEFKLLTSCMYEYGKILADFYVQQLEVDSRIRQARTGRGIYGLPKVSCGPAMPDPYTPCRLLPPWIPHAVRAWDQTEWFLGLRILIRAG